MKGFIKKGFVVIFLGAVLSACGIFNSASMIEKVKTEKVAEMQNLIGFSDAQAVELIRAEVKHSIALAKYCGNEQKTKELKTKRKIWLQNILGRQMYLRYYAIENDRIKKGDLIAW